MAQADDLRELVLSSNKIENRLELILSKLEALQDKVSALEEQVKEANKPNPVQDKAVDMLLNKLGNSI